MAKIPDFTCLLAWERFNDYVLMDALDGNFDPILYARASAAFAMTDASGMVAIADSQQREVDFIEADTLFATMEKPRTKPDEKGNTQEREWTIAERYAILKATEGTRAYARMKLDALSDNGDPFS